jgi:MinD superfamily P-loop ATPase
VFANIAAERFAVAVADADVEASNLPLALRATTTACTAFPGGARAVIDPSACDACGLCAQACRFGAISAGESGVFVVDPFACEGCRRCAWSAPTMVAMEPSTAGEAHGRESSPDGAAA